MPWILGGLALIAVVMLGGAAAVAVNEKADAGGVVQTDPYLIARSHGVSLDVEALARLAVSEAGSSEKAQIAVMWATRNMAKSRGESVNALLLRGRTKSGVASSSNGKFGAQNTGKYASTRMPSTAASRERAGKVMAGTIPDLTGGATQYDAPGAQNAASAAGVAGYSKTADQVAAERSKTAVAVMVPGVSNIRFWVPKDGVA